MRFKIHMKTPDAAEYALEDMNEEDKEEAKAFLSQYLAYGESLAVEFDTTKKTVEVLKIKR